jgi:flagellin
MALYINTNAMSLNAQKNLVSSGNAMATALERLSSGLRLNSAADDAAGMAIAKRLGGEYLGFNQAVRNANDGISMLQTAESAMDSMQNMMQRIRELSTQAASDTVGDTERGFINDEMQALLTEMNNIAARTEFNGTKLMTGAVGASVDAAGDVQVGMGLIADQAAVIGVDVSGAVADTYTFSYDTGTDVLTLTGTAASGTATDSVTLAAGVDGTPATYDFEDVGVSVTVGFSAATTADALGGAFDTETLVTTGSGLVIQVGAENSAENRMTVNFKNMQVLTSNTDYTELADLRTALDTFNGTSTRANAQTLLDEVNAALDAVSTQRSTLGAVQNRLDYTISSLMTAAENVAAAKGRIEDADFAAETANLTKNQILQQAGVSMLAQANALPQNVLALLQ